MKTLSELKFLQHPLVAKLLPENRNRFALWTAVVLLSGGMAFVLDRSNVDVTPLKVEAEDPASASTFIPEGFVLVPIEVANYESLDSILGKYGVVDLYTSPLDPTQKPRKVATRIKILRAPLNPNHFAVLAQEEDSSKLVGFSGPLTVIVQNPNSRGTGIVKGLEADAGLKSPRAFKRKLSRVTVEVANANPENEDE